MSVKGPRLHRTDVGRRRHQGCLDAVAAQKGRGDRFRLSTLQDSISELLDGLGFPLLEVPEVGENPRVRDSHRYYVVGAGYKSAFDEQISSLRPELKLERIQREPILPLETRTFGYLYETLAKRDLTTSVSISCISVAETAAEKVLSLLRRSAYKWDGHQTKGDIDPVLVRHVYDVAQIATKAPEALEASTSIFQTLVLNDRAEFRRLYAERLMPLIYDAKSLSFEDAFSTFEAVAHRLLDVCAIPSEPNGTTTN